MSYKIAIASGKGGTGKTTVAVNLFHFLRKDFSENIQLVDCDVEEPNDAIFFPKATITKREEIVQLIPKIDTTKCSFCRQCVEYCEFNAIVVIPPAKFAEVNDSLCHSCGACLTACENDAITEKTKRIGEVLNYDIHAGTGLLEGRLKVGSAMQTLLIRELKKHVPDKNEIILFDAPPGTSCPVVETISDVDYVILVTEPTPFGLNDLKLMVELLKEIKKPFGVIVNKAGIGNSDVYDYLRIEGIGLLGKIHFSKKYAARYAQGILIEHIPADIVNYYSKIIENLERRILVDEGNNYFKW